MISAIAIGAFGAHGLKNILLENNSSEIFNTASKYHFYQTLGLLFIGLFAQKNSFKGIYLSSIFMLLGMIIFSSTLYVLAITNLKWLGAITPIGGTLMIIGWFVFLLSCRRNL